MKRELGIACCGLACCLCSENISCEGCRSEGCPDKDSCENLKCASSNKLSHCFECSDDNCRKGLLNSIKALGFTAFARRYSVDHLLDCLERNDKSGIVYHREGIFGDYDKVDDLEELIDFIQSGQRNNRSHRVGT